MSRFKPIDKNKHKTHGWKLRSSMISAQKDSVVPVLMTEVTKLLPGYAFAFVKDKQGKFVFVAIQGVHKDDNLYVSTEGKPLYTPTPRVYHTYPFVLHETEVEGKANVILLFDHESGLYRESPSAEDEKRFFTDEGEVNPDIDRVLEYLTESEKWRKVTQKAVDAIVEADLLDKWDLGIKNLVPDKPMLHGFFRINIDKLSKLPPEALAQLRDEQALTLSYAQMFSVYRLEKLEMLYRLKYEKQENDNSKKELDDLDAFFDNESESLSVDWSKL